jgi:hypothetical protein
MRKIYFMVLAVLISAGCIGAGPKEKVEFKSDVANKKVEVYIGGKFFTSYMYPDNLEKQILYPIVSASGKTITRGFPLVPRSFERTDHPHHVGLWFNFGDVNGLDFWNNSYAIKAADKPKYGTIIFKKLVSMNPAKGELSVNADWVDINNKVLLNEQATYIFAGEGNLRTIERITKLTAVQDVSINENKEGMIGMRVDRAFEEPSTKAEKFLDAKGNLTDVPVMNNEGVNGVYRNAEGINGASVWAKKSPWVALRANKEGEVITIVILDHPKNPNYPAWSHARGYGLFATNNFGGSVIDKTSPVVKLVLKPGESVVIKHKVLIGGDLTDAEIGDMAKQFK